MPESVLPEDHLSLNNLNTLSSIESNKKTEDEKRKRWLLTLAAFYAFIDGLNLSSSTLRLYFDVLNKNNNLLSAKKMHQWMLSQQGVAAVSVESALLISFTLLAGIFSELDFKNENTKSLQTSYTITRNFLKSIKNAYKGIRSTLQVIELFAGKDLHYLMTPLGLGLGILSAFNRNSYILLIDDERKKIQAKNTKLLETIRLKEENRDTLVHFFDEMPDDLEGLKNSCFFLKESSSEFYSVDEKGVIKIIDPGKRNYARILHDLKTTPPSLSNPNPQQDTSLLLNKYQFWQCITSNTANYEAVLVTNDEPDIKENNTIYIKLSNGILQYAVKNPDGKEITHQLSSADLYDNNIPAKLSEPLTLEMLQPYLPKLLETASRLGHISTGHTQYQSLYNNIETQTENARMIGITSKLYGGIIDGLYLYMGAAVIIPMAPSLVIMACSFSLFFAATCVASRFYEEYCKQQDVLASADRVKLAICAKELHELFSQFEAIYDQEDPLISHQSLDEMLIIPEEQLDKLHYNYQTLFNEATLKICEFENYRMILENKIKRTYFTAIAEGVTDGLAVYGAMAAFMFSISTVSNIFGFSLSPVLLITCISLGTACLLSFVSFYIVQHALEEPQKDENKLASLVSSIKSQGPNALNITTEAGLAINSRINMFFNDRMNFDTYSSSPVANCSEVARSFGAGLGKAPKACEFTMGWLQDMDDNGKLHDSSLLLKIIFVLTLPYTMILAFSAYRERFIKSSNAKDNLIPDSDDSDNSRLNFLPASSKDSSPRNYFINLNSSTDSDEDNSSDGNTKCADGHCNTMTKDIKINSKPPSPNSVFRDNSPTETINEPNARPLKSNPLFFSTSSLSSRTASPLPWKRNKSFPSPGFFAQNQDSSDLIPTVTSKPN